MSFGGVQTPGHIWGVFQTKNLWLQKTSCQKLTGEEMLGGPWPRQPLPHQQLDLTTQHMQERSLSNVLWEILRGLRALVAAVTFCHKIIAN